MRLVLLALLALGACAPEPERFMCDYCKKERVDARPYACRKCGKPHNSCAIERPLHEVDLGLKKDGVSMGRSVKVCP